MCKSYATPGGGRLTVLENINLVIESNEFVSFLGPSGCGKTTLLKIMDHIVEPDSGDILLGGAPMEQSLHEIGFVFQEVGLLAWRDVIGNIALGLDARGLDKNARREIALKYATMVGLEQFADHYPHQLSGGMAQRVGLARALAISPRLLLMDEPFGALDAMTRATLQEELSRILANFDTTVVFVTHDISEAIFLSDRIVVFDRNPGRVVAELEVDLPRPRVERDVATHPIAHQLHEQILELLGGHPEPGRLGG